MGASKSIHATPPKKTYVKNRQLTTRWKREIVTYTTTLPTDGRMNASELRELLISDSRYFVPVMWQQYIDRRVDEIKNGSWTEKVNSYKELQADIQIFRPPGTIEDKGYVYDVFPTHFMNEREMNDSEFAFLKSDDFGSTTAERIFYTDYRGATTYRFRDNIKDAWRPLESLKTVDRIWFERWYPMLNIDKAVEIMRPVALALCSLFPRTEILNSVQKKLLHDIMFILPGGNANLIDCDVLGSKARCAIFRGFLIAMMVTLFFAQTVLTGDQNGHIEHFINNVRWGMYKENPDMERVKYVVETLILSVTKETIEEYKKNIAINMSLAFKKFQTDAFLPMKNS